jgi:hypothetical protein
MTIEHTKIQCAGHGEAYSTFVCEHLATKVPQEWFGDLPEEDNPWPDAWCAKCNSIFLREGEWNEENEKEIKLKIICDRCYSDARSLSVDYLSGSHREKWDSFVSTCCSELERKQDWLEKEFALSEHRRWNWDQETGQLIFSNDGVPALIAQIEFIGSVSTISDTWLWAWANFSLNLNMRNRVTKVRQFGEQEHFPHLKTSQWCASEHDGWHMAAVAARVIGAIGVYRAQEENGASFLALMSVARA